MANILIINTIYENEFTKKIAEMRQEVAGKLSKNAIYSYFQI